MKKIFTVRDLSAQREHMWEARRVDEEVAACERRHLLQHLLAWLPKDAPILEAGCGLGAWVVALAERGYDIAGIDNDAAVIERLRESRPGLRVSQGEVLHLPFADGALGAVISLGVLEHFEGGCEEALRETWRVLRPGGVLVFTVPADNLFRKLFAHPLRELWLLAQARRGNAKHFAEYRYTPREVEALLRANRFTPQLTTWDDYLPLDMSMGIWTDFPPLHAARLFELTWPGRAAAVALNGVSRRLACAGVLCIARKEG